MIVLTEERRIYSYDQEITFQAVKNVCSRSWFVIKEIDESIGRIIMSTPPSLFSYGENVEVIVQPKDEGTLVYIKSKPKVFFNISAGGAVERNINRLYQMLDEELR